MWSQRVIRWDVGARATPTDMQQNENARSEGGEGGGGGGGGARKIQSLWDCTKPYQAFHGNYC